MTTLACRAWAAPVILATLAISMTGCRTEYHGHDSDIDGVLWRQIASFEDPLSRDASQPSTDDPADSLSSIEGTRWNGAVTSAADLDLGRGGGVLYDVSATDSAATFSVFIASGPRPDVPTDDGRRYSGPSEVYTCYRIEADFSEAPSVLSPAPPVRKTIFRECPEPLVGLLASDAAFASGEVFDG